MGVYLISGDLISYKIVLMSWRPFDGRFEPRIIDGQISQLLRVRIYDLFFNQEVICPLDPAAGFGSISSGSEEIARHIALYLDHGVRIADRRKIRGSVQ